METSEVIVPNQLSQKSKSSNHSKVKKEKSKKKVLKKKPIKQAESEADTDTDSEQEQIKLEKAKLKAKKKAKKKLTKRKAKPEKIMNSSDDETINANVIESDSDEEDIRQNENTEFYNWLIQNANKLKHPHLVYFKILDFMSRYFDSEKHELNEISGVSLQELERKCNEKIKEQNNVDDLELISATANSHRKICYYRRTIVFEVS